jgi:OOP family OmpA-OmpF porin
LRVKVEGVEKIVKRIRSGLIVAGLLTTATIANAQPIMGLYVGGGRGYNSINNFSLKSQPGGGGGMTGSRFKTDGGFAGARSVGWGFGNSFRTEVEGNYRSQTIGLSGPAGVTISGGRQSSYGVMVNELHDFNIGGSIYSYLGAGVGYQVSALRGSFNSSGPLDGSQPGFGVQGIAGITIQGGGRLRTENQFNHSVIIGLRHAFNSPTMTAAVAVNKTTAAPAPAAARTYLVFFDWDRAELAPRARQINGNAAQASSKVATTRIEVSGNADRTGAAAYH